MGLPHPWQPQPHHHGDHQHQLPPPHHSLRHSLKHHHHHHHIHSIDSLFLKADSQYNQDTTEFIEDTIQFGPNPIPQKTKLPNKLN